jgi:hypothetical protein
MRITCAMNLIRIGNIPVVDGSTNPLHLHEDVTDHRQGAKADRPLHDTMLARSRTCGD